MSTLEVELAKADVVTMKRDGEQYGMGLNFGTGHVTWNSFEADLSVPVEEQIGLLDEDLIQVEYSRGYTLDIGWRPSWSLEGRFYVCVIRNCDWDNAIIEISFRDIVMLKNVVDFCVALIEKTSPNE